MKNQDSTSKRTVHTGAAERSIRSALALPSRKPGRPPKDSVARFQRNFLRVALDAFLDNGFEGASINSIARAAGISRDTFYRQYGSKEQLFRAATGYGMSRLTEHLRVVVTEPGVPAEVLRRVIQQIHADTAAPDAVAIVRLIVAEAHRFPDLARQMFADTKVALGPLIDYLQNQREAGVLDFDDPFEAAYNLAVLATGGVRVFLEPPPVRAAVRERHLRRIVKLLIQGWKPGRAA